MKLEELENIKKKIELLSLHEKIEIFKIIKENNINYTQNKNGIFVIMNNIDPSLIEKIESFLVFLNDTKKRTKEIEEKIINLKID